MFFLSAEKLKIHHTNAFVLRLVYFLVSSKLFQSNSTSEPHHEESRICICQNKDADQLCGDQRLCFCYKFSTIPVLP